MIPPGQLQVVGVILAGGLARRMGGADKALRRFGHGTLLSSVLDRLRPQVRVAMLNANGDPARFAEFGLPVVPDPVPGHPGPLAGVLAGLEWTARMYPDVASVVTVPCDTPFIPHDLVARLLSANAARQQAIAVACSSGRTHPTVALWPVSLAGRLREAITRSGTRKVSDLQRDYSCVHVEWNDDASPFLNINSDAELQDAAARYSK